MTEKTEQHRHPDDPITLDGLKGFLWAAATHLCGQTDAAEYKEYIFPLPFFKRVSDVHDEQFGGFVCEGGAEYADMQIEDLPIRIPDGAHWRDVCEVTGNVSSKLIEASIAIKQTNPAKEMDGKKIGGLESVFGSKDSWVNRAKMPDGITTPLIEDSSKHTLSLKTRPADEMGQAYGYLIGKFTNDTGDTAQEFYTSRTVVQPMTEMLQPQSGGSTYDPTCGPRGMLAKCLDYLHNKGAEWQSAQVPGQEVNGLTSSIAQINLCLNGAEDFSTACAGTLGYPALLDDNHLRKFDIVLVDPPYSVKEWSRGKSMDDKQGCNFLGTPPQEKADHAFLQHIVVSANRTQGRYAILFPHGVLFRDEELELRKKLVKMDILDCIIGLGVSLFYNSPMEAYVLICNCSKANDKKNQVLMINIVNEVTRENAESMSLAEYMQGIVDAYRRNRESDGFSRIVSNDEIRGKKLSLNISLYTYQSVLQDALTVSKEDTISVWTSSHSQYINEMDELIKLTR